MNTVLLGDLHLTDADPRRGYKRPEVFADQRLLQCLEWIEGLDNSRLILTGDVFDIDLVVLEQPGADPGQAAVRKLSKVFADHQPLLAALARFAARGRLQWLMGNHDLELSLPQARRALDDELERHAPGAAAGLRLHRWALYEPGLLWAEHGHVYDAYACSHDPFDPRLDDGIYFPFGCLVNQQLSNALTSFNPNSDEQVHQGIAGYLRHWLRFDFWPPWRLPLAYLTNAATVYKRALDQRARLDALPGLDELTQRAVDELGLQREQARELLRELPRPVIHFSRFEPLRTLLLDKAVLIPALAVGAGAAVVASSSPVAPLFWPLCAVAFYMGYEWLLGPSKAVGKERVLPRIGLRAAEIVDAPLCVMGHSHDPGRVEGQGRTYLNPGSWGPLFSDVECTRRSSKADTLVRIEHGEGPPRAELLAWRNGRAVRL
ncbi:MAG: metallophosphoesterase [Candidatus Alcyoniella australis]|nr:metallophosphoesterase [Candidatus Alcyoniella australis]